MIVKNRLLNFNNTFIYQDNDYFLFSLDAVLLANFVKINPSQKKIMDLCTGNAPIPMLLSFRTRARIFGVEIQKDVFELGKKSIIENDMDKQIELINYDVKKISELYPSESFDIITCNPPYFRYTSNKMINDNDVKTNARHETLIKLEDVFKTSKYLLTNGGTLAMVNRPDRFIECLDLLKKYSFEVKRIQFVYPKVGKEANMVLIEANKGGKPGLKILNPLVVHNDNGEYTDEIRKMFGDDNDVAGEL